MTQSKAPWFVKPTRINHSMKVAIIGAGIAGCCLALRLKNDGHDVTLFDRNDRAGLEGSGNQIGLIKPRLDLDKRGFGAFNKQAYLYAVDYYDQLVQDGIPVWIGSRGLFEMAENDQDSLRQQMLIDAKILSSDEMCLLSKEEASLRLGVAVPNGGLWYSRSGCVEPSKLCQILVKDIQCAFNQNITALKMIDHTWQLYDCDKVIFEGDCVVLATAGETQTLNPFCDLHFEGRRGQVSYLRATDETKTLKYALSCEGYVTQALINVEGIDCHLVGASFERWADFSDKSYLEMRENSNENNRDKMKRFFPDWEGDILGGRVGMRAMTLDHLPMVGPLYDDKTYVEKYARLKHGPRAQVFENADYIDGLYIMAGLGARGVQTAPLLADLLSSYISGTSSPVEEIVREALHPARFKIRSIKREKP
jgi:tRNA 5-methylaminomethyl-2-thiouridine biosynthesis bifunctional protein